MNNILIRKKIVLNFIPFFSVLIFLFFSTHIFFGDRSIWKIFILNSEISTANQRYNDLIKKKEDIISEIELLRDFNLDTDYITEISLDQLGLIQSDQIVIDITD